MKRPVSTLTTSRASLCAEQRQVLMNEAASADIYEASLRWISYLRRKVMEFDRGTSGAIRRGDDDTLTYFLGYGI